MLEIVIHAFQRGETPESIVDSYNTLSLDDVYAVLAYYLQNRDEVEAYLKQVEVEAKIIREKIEAHQPQANALRERILKKLDEKRSCPPMK